MAASTSAAQREINIAQIRENLFPPSTTTAAVAPRIPIIDSHIHLYPSSEESTLAWLPTPPTDPPHPLAGQHSLDEYTAATHAPRELEGFVFLETDRINDLESGAKDGSGWKYPLMEVEWLKRIALGTPKPGEGHDEKQKELCLAIIPWAPLPSGVEAMEKYLELVAESAGESFDKIRGFRYLVQHKPQGTMLGDGFIESLKWLGRKGYVFDHGVDSHRGGDWQLDETVEMIKRAHEGVEEKDKVVFIISGFIRRSFPVGGTC
jgi:L-rhamnono-1,4-lactonase